MIMDFLRSGYTTSAKFIREDPAIGGIKWFRAAPGAKVFPHAHDFASLVWTDEEYQGAKTLGEQSYSRTWSPTKGPALAGQHFHGKPEWYLRGIPREELLKPWPEFLCGGPLQVGSGGLALGGRALFPAPPILFGRGGVAIGGAAWFDLVGSGGVAIGGAASFAAGVAQLGEGGIALGGAAWFDLVGSGGVAIGGAALFGEGVAQFGEGGIALGGAAELYTGVAQLGEGGIALGGAAEFSASVTFEGTGGIGLGGAADMGPGVTLFGTGGIGLGGAAEFSATVTFEGTGGIALGGVAELYTGVAQLGEGGIALGGPALFRHGTAQTGTGGIELGGPANFTALQRGLGGIELGGAAVQAHGTLLPGLGGPIIGGNAIDMPIQIGSGGIRLGGTGKGTIASLPNLTYWANASTGTYSDLNGTTTPVSTDGSRVGTWTDKAASAHTHWAAFNSTRATLKTNIINGFPVLRFNGTTEFLKRDFNDVNDATIIAVCKDTSAAASHRTLVGCTSSQAGALDEFYFKTRDPSNVSAFFVWNYAGTAYQATMSQTLGSFFIFSGRRRGLKIDIWNGHTVGTQATASGTLATQTHPHVIGCGMFNDNQADYWAGDLAEIVISSDPIADNILYDVVEELRAKYAL